MINNDNFDFTSRGKNKNFHEFSSNKNKKKSSLGEKFHPIPISNNSSKCAYFSIGLIFSHRFNLIPLSWEGIETALLPGETRS